MAPPLAVLRLLLGLLLGRGECSGAPGSRPRGRCRRGWMLLLWSGCCEGWSGEAGGCRVSPTAALPVGFPRSRRRAAGGAGPRRAVRDDGATARTVAPGKEGPLRVNGEWGCAPNVAPVGLRPAALCPNSSRLCPDLSNAVPQTRQRCISNSHPSTVRCSFPHGLAACLGGGLGEWSAECETGSCLPYPYWMKFWGLLHCIAWKL